MIKNEDYKIHMLVFYKNKNVKIVRFLTGSTDEIHEFVKNNDDVDYVTTRSDKTNKLR